MPPPTFNLFFLPTIYFSFIHFGNPLSPVSAACQNVDRSCWLVLAQLTAAACEFTSVMVVSGAEHNSSQPLSCPPTLTFLLPPLPQCVLSLGGASPSSWTGSESLH